MKEVTADSVEHAVALVMRQHGTKMKRIDIDKAVMELDSRWSSQDIDSALGVLQTESHGMLPWVKRTGYGKNIFFELTPEAWT